MSNILHKSLEKLGEHSFNIGTWKKLENQVRRWALVKDSIYVITGLILTYSSI